MQVIATWHGGTARMLRHALRLSCDDFASLLGMSSRGVAKWEANPAQELALQTQQLLDIALKRADDDAVARFAQLVERTLEEEPPSPSLVIPAPIASRQATPELVRSLEQALTSHYTTDNLLGPKALLPVVAATADTIEDLQRGASGDLLDDLLRVGAGYAEFAGWLSQDAGDDTTATGWYRRSLEWSEAAGDARMASFVLTRRAVQHLATADTRKASRLAVAAQRDGSPVTARVRAIAAQTEALAHAMSGDHGESDRALSIAAQLVDRADADDIAGDPSIGRYCEMPLYLAISQAKCHLELKRPAEAVAAFTAVLNMLPADFHRDRGQYLSRLARAHVLAEQPDEACARAEESLAIAIATGSTRTITELRHLHADLRPWESSAAVARLTEALAHAVHAPGGR